MKKDLKKVYSKDVLHKRKKKRKIQKAIIFMIFLIAILITICIKAPFFNIKNISVVNNKIVSADEVKKSAALKEGNNIFYFNSKQLSDSIKTIPYIKNVEISRKLPSTLVVKVEEREAFFYGKKDENYYVFDNEGRVLDICSNIEKLTLTEVKGIDLAGINVGDKIKVSNERVYEFLKEFSRLLSINTSTIKFTNIDVADFLNIKVNYNNIEIVLGRDDDLKNKLNLVINILEEKPELQKAKGYINVSFKGNPVIHLN